jgi:hypothetical protein
MEMVMAMQGCVEFLRPQLIPLKPFLIYEYALKYIDKSNSCRHLCMPFDANTMPLDAIVRQLIQAIAGDLRGSR